MSITPTVRAIALGSAVLVGGAVAVPAEAQSLLARGGLGFPLEALDARARGLGGVGHGLPGLNLSPDNPAEAARIVAPTLQATVQPDGRVARVGGEEARSTSVRFPLIHAAFPFGERWSGSVSYRALVDQTWGAEQADTIRFEGDEIAVQDRFLSEGGIAAFRVGVATLITPRLAVGAGVDLYTGDVTRSLTRVFDPERELASTRESARWDYRGVGAAAGVAWTPPGAVRVSASVESGAELTARPVGGEGEERSYRLPLTVRAGASASIAERTVAAASASWSGWGAEDGRFAGAGGSRDGFTVAGGLEWEPPAPGERAFPIRIGARHATLPFAWSAAGETGFPTERALTAGLGARLADGAARADLAIERGSRAGTGTDFEETFWRVVVSLTALGQ